LWRASSHGTNLGVCSRSRRWSDIRERTILIERAVSLGEEYDYGHVIDELDEAPRIAAEDAIRAARGTVCHWRAIGGRVGAWSGRVLDARKPALVRAWGEWAIQDSNLGPLPYQRSALTD
jgi:hypothetical protein